MGLLGTTSQQAYYQGGKFGNYQFISLGNVIDNFMATYIGEDKILTTTKRSDVSFHAHRALAELTFDTFKSCKSQEIEVPSSLTMTLPQDYVNYTKISWSDSSGIKHRLYPTLCNTSNPTNPEQNSDGDFALQAVGTMDQSQTIILDAEYKNIIVGMRVSSPNIPSGSIVYNTKNSGSITTIQIWDGTNIVNTTYTGTETLTFTNSDGSLILSPESSFILENITWTNGDNKLTQSPNTDVSNIKVGMLVSNIAVTPGTTVTDVNGAVITISNATLFGFTPSVDNEFTFISADSLSDTWSNYKSGTPSENQDDYQGDTFWPMAGERYGLDPQHAQANGSFYIDQQLGKIHFSSNISGKTVILDYISDSLGTDAEMQVHKFAEEAIYKWIAYGCLIARMNTPEYVIARFKREKFAETRKAKLRLSNIKLEEITQVLRGKSKHIKH